MGSRNENHLSRLEKILSSVTFLLFEEKRPSISVPNCGRNPEPLFLKQGTVAAGGATPQKSPSSQQTELSALFYEAPVGLQTCPGWLHRGFWPQLLYTPRHLLNVTRFETRAPLRALRPSSGPGATRRGSRRCLEEGLVLIKLKYIHHRSSPRTSARPLIQAPKN